MKTLWPHARAAFVVFHLVAVTLMALPAPGGGMSRSQWAEPTVQAEFRLWNARLARFGVRFTEREFEDGLFALALRVTGAREVALAPFQPYYRVCHTGQSWRMFVAPHMFPERLYVDVEEGGAWRSVFVERDPRFAWRREVFDHDRLRSAIFRYAWKKYRPSYEEFADWVAGEAHRDFPEATRVRVRFWKAPSPSPEQARAGREPEGAWEDALVRRLGRSP